MLDERQWLRNAQINTKLVWSKPMPGIRFETLRSAEVHLDGHCIGRVHQIEQSAPLFPTQFWSRPWAYSRIESKPGPRRAFGSARDAAVALLRAHYTAVVKPVQEKVLAEAKDRDL